MGFQGLIFIVAGGHMNQKTKCIWKNGENNENTWMCFVKKFTVTDSFEKAITHIAVDSKYWLYINGKLAIFEGGIKRGPDKHSTYYDEIRMRKLHEKSLKDVKTVCYFIKSFSCLFFFLLLFVYSEDYYYICSAKVYYLQLTTNNLLFLILIKNI